MKVNQDMNEQIQQLCEWYGDGSDGSCPTAVQWARILAQPSGKPVTLVNFFKLRANAQYEENGVENDLPGSGDDAFGRYAAVSIPTMEKVGGNFLHVGPFVGTFLGEDEDWDIIAIGAYPTLKSFLGLYTDKEYRKAFVHRTAACERQKVLICANSESKAVDKN